MNIIENQSAKLISTGESNNFNGFRIIEIAGRTCYHSLSKINEDSAEKFINSLIKSEHYAPMENYSIYLKIPVSNISATTFFGHNKYSKTINDGNFVYVTTNYRVIIENGVEEYMKYQCAYEKGNHVMRLTVQVTTNLQVLGEFTRHRVFSYAVESTRYCAYSKDKFDNNVNFIRPNFGIYIKEPKLMDEWEKDMGRAEYAYLKLSKMGANAQECAQVLPKATKCDMVISGCTDDWKHFFDLRLRGTTGKPHPQMLELAELIHEEFENIGLNL